VSHPKEFNRIPPLERSDAFGAAASPVLIVDDLATSGWHLEEALTNARDGGLSAVGAAWISGSVL
jgi:hypothetical protein